MHKLEIHGQVALLRMVHGKANALDIEFLRHMKEVLEHVESSDALAVVLTGRGSIFSAGVDLPRLLAEGASYLRDYLPALESFFNRLFMFSKPVIAAINGHAIAGGCVIACACDRRLVARGKLSMGVPELVVGVPFPPVALEIMLHAVPRPFLQEAVYSGSYYGVDECLRRGFADEDVSPEELIDRALATAASLAAIPSQSFALNKRMLRRSSLDRLERHEAALTSVMLDVWSSPEVRRAIRRYVERTLERRS